MIFDENKYRFMTEALKEAVQAFDNGEVPIGAVIVKENKIIGRGHNQVEKLHDATAHAEMIAITAAENFLGDWRLQDCELYVNVEPCVMCTGAILLSRLNKLYFGVFDPKFGACGSIYNVLQEGKLNHKPKVYSGLLEKESRLLLKDFFIKSRNKKLKK